MENRLHGTIPTLETRRESYDTVDKKKRYGQIIEIMRFNNVPMSAKEIAIEMCMRDHTPTSERNFVSPRITELMKNGIVEQTGKKKCSYTKKTVTVFSLREGA